MGKKIPLLISTLTLCASGLTSVTAWAEEAPKTSWTYEEMSALNAEVEAEVNEHCASDDPMCRDSYLYSNKSGDVYRALEHYRGHALAITAINPNNHTLRVAYDTNLLSANVAPEKLTVKDLYIVQGEVSYYIGDYVSAIKNQDTTALEHLKVLFAKDDAGPDEVWLPYNTEIELSVPELASGESLASSAENYSWEPLSPSKYRSILSVNYNASNLISAWGDMFDFSDCLNSLDEDMECQIRYGTGSVFYEAAKIESGETNSEAEVTTSATVSVEPSETATSGYGGAILGAENSPTAEIASSAPATAPDTGQNTAEKQTGATEEFPWWIGGIVIFGLATLAWLFWPKTKKS